MNIENKLKKIIIKNRNYNTNNKDKREQYYLLFNRIFNTDIKTILKGSDYVIYTDYIYKYITQDTTTNVKYINYISKEAIIYIDKLLDIFLLEKNYKIETETNKYIIVYYYSYLFIELYYELGDIFDTDLKDIFNTDSKDINIYLNDLESIINEHNMFIKLKTQDTNKTDKILIKQIR